MGQWRQLTALQNWLSKTSSMQRVKVCYLDEDGIWYDRGTGHVTMDYVEQSEDLGLYVIDEDDNTILLVHRISIEDIYRKEEYKIISWRDPYRSTEIALSFQEFAGCYCVWDQISNIQRNLNFNSLDTYEKIHNVNSELRELPDVNLSTLPQILKIVTESDITNQMRFTDLLLKDDGDFFQNLMNLFDICKDSKNVVDLHVIINIVKGIISLNSPMILAKIFGDKLIMKIIRCLEYNPDAPQPQDHQNYLKECVVFKEAIPIKEPLVRSKIHETYKIGYLRDIVLTGVLNDATVATLDLVITANKDTVVALLKDDRTFFQELFARLRSPSTSVESRNDLVHFLHEICSLSKNILNTEQQGRLLRELIDDGIFDIIAEVLESPVKKLVLIGVDILCIFLTQVPNLVRSYVVQPDTLLLGLLVKRMMGDFGDTMDYQIKGFFQNLLDSDASSCIAQPSNIMDIFCDKHLAELVDFIAASCPERPDNTSKGASRRVDSNFGTKPTVLLNICDLLCFCFQQESFRTIFLHKNMTEKVLLLTQRKEKAIVAAAIRVFRTLLSVRDDYVLHSYIVKHNLMKPIIDVLVTNGNRENLVVSAVLELLEHIRKLKTTVLLKYVVDTFGEQLTPFENLNSIQAFKTSYEQECLESRESSSSSDPVEIMSLDEDNYVNETSNKEKSDSAPKLEKGEAASSVSRRYEMDEDCKPICEKQEEVTPRLKNRSPRIKYEKERCKRPKLWLTIEEEGGKGKEMMNLL